MRDDALPLESAAVRTWESAPGQTSIVPRAFFLPDQLERITGWEFAAEHPRREVEGGISAAHAPTRGFLIENAWLIDGVLYKGSACSHLLPRSHRIPRLRVDVELERGALFCSTIGNKYFGSWLLDDCPRYALAAHEGLPVTTDQPASAHIKSYEDWLEMKPVRLGGAFFRELVIFEDVGQNRDKHRRFRAMSEKLLSHVDRSSHPGVFILRGRAGQRRILVNELELAEHLSDTRGFRVLDPLKADVPTIVATCAGAQTVIGVEGSALIHGVLTLAPQRAILVLQPPNRFVTVFKHLADRDGHDFGFVVGHPEGEDFRIAPDEVERTLDLFPARGG